MIKKVILIITIENHLIQKLVKYKKGIQLDRYPENVGIIMDGNRRWALSRARPPTYGHKQGTKTLKNIVNYCNSINLKELTVFAFSTENRNRSSKEVQSLFFLAEWSLND